MFQAGDVVMLKSGGPYMTVRWCADRNGVLTAYCDWFEKNEAKGHAFMPGQLKKVEDDE